MKPLISIVRWLLGAAWVFGVSQCGQTEITIPDSSSWRGTCGDWYPSGDDEDDVSPYGFDTAKVFPCLVFESARLNGEDTYIDMGGIYLDAEHGLSDTASVVFVIGAADCPSCAVLAQDLAGAAADIEASGATMINVTFCSNIDRTDCDFDLDRAEATASAEGWPTAQWVVTNDEEAHLRPLFQDTFPTVIIVKVSDMQVITVDDTPEAQNILAVLRRL